MYNCSLNDNTELRNLIVNNPGLPLLIFCGEDSWHDEWAYEQAQVNQCRVEELAMLGEQWICRDDYTDELSDKMACDAEYCDLPDDEFNALVEKKVSETDFVKAIVIYVG